MLLLLLPLCGRLYMLLDRPPTTTAPTGALEPPTTVMIGCPPKLLVRPPKPLLIPTPIGS